MRVAHILRKFDPSAWGGTETHVAAVTARLSDLDVVSEVHAPSGPSGRGALDPRVRLRRFDAWCPFLGSADRLRALRGNAGNLVTFGEPVHLARDRGLSLAHVHTQGRIGGAVRSAMRATGRPYVVSVHGPLLAEPELLRAETRARLAGTIDLGKPVGLLLGSRRVVDDAARVIVFNEDERRALERRIGARVVRMDHGVDAARFAAGDAARGAARFPELGSGPVVSLVGRLSRQKNQLLAVRAFARGAPAGWRLALAGAETDPGVRAEVEAEARALGVAERVHVLGNVAPDAVPDLLARSALVLTPSTHEAFGLCVLEAWAAGAPVLFVRRTGLADLAEAAGPDVTTTSSLEVEDWAAALAALVADPARRAASARAGLRVVGERYRWDVVANRLLDLYRRVLAEAASRRVA